MSEHEYAPAREPTSEEWAVRAKFLELGRSVPKTAFALGMERQAVIHAVMICRYWTQDSGYAAEYAEAKRMGFSDADARLRAEIVASYNTRQQNG